MDAPPPSGPPPGWYRDPDEAGDQRWWDGAGWTEHRQGVEASPPGLQATPPPPTGHISRSPWPYVVGGGLVLLAIAAVLVAVLLGGEEESDVGQSFQQQQAEAQDAEAKAFVRNAQTAMEVYATNNGGSYQGATVFDVQEIEPTLSDVSLVVEVADTDEYTVTVESPTGNSFAVTRNTDGTTTFSCEVPGEVGCPESRDWGES